MIWVFWLKTVYGFVEGSCSADLKGHFYLDGHGKRPLSRVSNHLTNYSAVTQTTTATNFTAMISKN
jgi:hypothetical protein